MIVLPVTVNGVAGKTLIYSYLVIPAQAGIQNAFCHFHAFLGPR